MTRNYSIDDTFEYKMREYLIQNNSRLDMQIIKPFQMLLSMKEKDYPKEFIDDLKKQYKEQIINGIANDMSFSLALPYEECYTFLEPIDLTAWTNWNDKYESDSTSS